ncbi:conserved exported hypothetical protein [Gammaproteobacteria bacterium]
MKSHTVLFASLLAFSVVGCSNQAASFLVGTSNHALTLELSKSFFWSNWDLEVTVRNGQKCQRRHILEPSYEKSPQVEVNFPEQNFLILRQNTYWYVADMKLCSFQEYKQAPHQPGNLIGAFQNEGGSYQFVKKP